MGQRHAGRHKSKTTATGKRKSPRAKAPATKKKSKTLSPGNSVSEFATKYGRAMFGSDGAFPLTPAQSADCGRLLQRQKWYENKSEIMGLQDTFEFTDELAEELTDDEAVMVAQGQDVDIDSLTVFVDLIDAVGNFCNFDQSLDTKGKLGVVFGSQCPKLAKAERAAEQFCLHMRNHHLLETSEL